jgi:hypothetical protein
VIQIQPGSLAALAAQLYPHTDEGFGEDGQKSRTDQSLDIACDMVEKSIERSFEMTEKLSAKYADKFGPQPQGIAVPTFTMPPPPGGGFPPGR